MTIKLQTPNMVFDCEDITCVDCAYNEVDYSRLHNLPFSCDLIMVQSRAVERCLGSGKVSEDE